MSVQERRKYDSDFKRNAVQLTAEPGRPDGSYCSGKPRKRFNL